MKLSKVIEMLEKNPKLQFKGTSDNKKSAGFMKVKADEEKIWLGGTFIYLDRNWEIVPEPVPAWQAIKALLTEGKSVRCVCKFGEFVLKELDLTCGQNLTLARLVDGTWYIIEDTPID